MMEDIERIIKMFEQARVSKLDLEFDNIKIKLEKNEDEPHEIVVNKENPMTTSSKPSTPEGFAIKSPVVGTYYAAKAAGDTPFVTVGQKVKKGDTVCIIEAMKVMNEIKSPVDGVVKEILVSNEDLVEYDEAIIVIGD